MNIKINRRGPGRSVHSRAKALLGVGAASVLVVAGIALAGVLPASAATSLTFSALSPTSVFANEAFSFNITVNGGTSGDTITITSTNCTFGAGETLVGTYTSGVVDFSGIEFTTANAACNLTATDNNGGTGTSSIDVTAFGAPDKIAFKTAPPSTVPANSAITPAFTVATEDQYGNVVTSGTGSADAIQIVSSCALGGTIAEGEIAGVATFNALTINAVSTCSLTAEDTTSPDNAFTVSSGAITVTAGAPTKVVFTTAPPATDLTIGSALTTFAVSVEDVNGNVEKTTTGSADLITITASGCTLGGTDAEVAVAGVATFADVTVTTAGTCVLTATDSTRVLVTATATTIVGEAQAALTVTSLTGYKDAPLTLTTSGGSGTGAVTFSVTNGTATGCLITNGALTATTAGTCLVTATKAAAAPYAGVNSAATTVTISSAPKAVRVSGTVTNNHKSTVTITGYNFSGRPKVISNVAGFSAVVSHDSGTSLTVVLTIKGNSKPGVKVMTIILASGARTSVRYSLHG